MKIKVAQSTPVVPKGFSMHEMLRAPGIYTCVDPDKHSDCRFIVVNNDEDETVCLFMRDNVVEALEEDSWVAKKFIPIEDEVTITFDTRR